MFVHVSECEFVSPNCSKFAVECDRNSKIFQNIQNVFYFEKIDGFKKNLIFLKIPEGGKLAVECVSKEMVA